MTWKLLTCGPGWLNTFAWLTLTSVILAAVYWWKPGIVYTMSYVLLLSTGPMIESTTKDLHFQAPAAGVSRVAIERTLALWRVIVATTMWATVVIVELHGPRPFTSRDDKISEFYLTFGTTPEACLVWLAWTVAFVTATSKITYGESLRGKPKAWDWGPTLQLPFIVLVVAVPLLAPKVQLSNLVWLAFLVLITVLRHIYTLHRCRWAERRKVSHV